MTKRKDLPASELKAGFQVGVLVSAAATIVVFAALVPVNEFRARLVVLLQRPGDLSLHSLLLAILILLGGVGLVISRSLSWKGLAGVAAAAALSIALIGSGALAWFPEIHSRTVQWIVVGLTVLATTARLIQLRLGSQGKD